jgi:hypothetical protein
MKGWRHIFDSQIFIGVSPWGLDEARPQGVMITGVCNRKTVP